ncbi:porin [Colwellia sp. 75C3]|uniref:porin n=1 Tax=Colwellia sp. 75C3 TaxID=888425 RepID=UPI000C33EF88|nr:porin [Colwellia sp. 75C3]PKG85711.1 porin [Colwellia sp. 75C3]
MIILKYAIYPLMVSLIYCQSALSQSSTSLEELTKQVNLLQKKLELVEKEQNANVTSITTEASKKNLKLTPQKNEVRVYATVRPTFGYIDENNEKTWDVRDALSHTGFKATSYFKEDWSAVVHGEWGIDLSNNGDFGKARQVYVALNSPMGSIGIGKQRPTQYLFIAEYVDIFNHSNSPFSYDPESIFFVDNLITYKLNTGNITWMLASQFDGSEGDNNSDLTNIGISYDKEAFHTAFTYLNQDHNVEGVKEGEDEIFAGSLAYEFSNSLYLAIGYQNKNYQRKTEPDSRDGHTIDLSASYKLTKIFKLKLGVFDFSDGDNSTQSRDFNGYNTTLEWLPSSSLRFHIEYLHREFDYYDDFSSISIGFRYDFSLETKY